MDTNSKEANNLKIEYGGATQIQLPTGDFTRISKLGEYLTINSYLSKNWTDTHTISGKQLLLITEKTEFFEKFLKENGYILQTRPPKKEHPPKKKPELTSSNDVHVAVAGGGDGGGGGGGSCSGGGSGDSKNKGDDNNAVCELFFVDEFMKQAIKDQEKTIKQENDKEIIIPTEEQSKNLKKNTTLRILDIRIMYYNSILDAYKSNFSEIKLFEKDIKSIKEKIPIDLDDDADEIISEKQEYVEKLEESIRSFQEILYKMLDDFEIEYYVFDINDEKSTNKFLKMCIDEYNLRKKILELDKKLISRGLEECEEYSEEEFIKKEKELASLIKG